MNAPAWKVGEHLKKVLHGFKSHPHCQHASMVLTVARQFCNLKVSVRFRLLAPAKKGKT